MKPSPAEAEQDAVPQRPPRFTYPSGSRPLDGYTIKRGVGRGGFGEVYFAVSDAGKEVALKLIRRNLDVELRGVTQCLNLKHPNLIALYDIRSDDQDDRWVVMEFVSGESLEDVIERHPQGMPTELALSWFSGICAGVEYLHDHGIVHRDLKPANIFLDDGTVKIGDYGLSKFISCSRRSGQTESVGTVHYMAPEIANGRYGREIDTYALGVILYEMLTGHVPFEGESVGEVLMKHLTAEPNLAGLKQPYRDIVSGALTKDPDRRIKNVGEMLRRLPDAPPTAQRLSDVRLEEIHPNEDAHERKAASEDDEPILASLKAGWRDLEERVHTRTSNWHPVVKVAALVGVVWFMVVSSPLWVETLLVLAVVYLIYRAGRAIFLGSGGSRSHRSPVGASPQKGKRPAAARPVSARVYASHRQRRQSIRQRLEEHVAGKTLHERLTELCGGMLVASLVAALASITVLLVSPEQSAVETYVWTAVVTTLSAWAVMIPARLSEGHLEDQAPMRFTQMMMGALVGLAAWAVAGALLLQFPVGDDFPVIGPRETLLSSHIDGLSGLSNGMTGVPLGLFVGYFAGMFLLYGFWRGADSLRTNRVSLWSVAWCGLVAWMLHFIWWFPQPIGLVIAGITAFTVQFASPWLPPSRRRKLVEAMD